MPQHLSPSQLESLSKCEMQWYFRYVMKRIIPPSIAMTTGSAVDGGCTANFTQKIDTHEDLPESVIVDVSVNEFESRIDKDGINLSEDEAGRGKMIVIGEATDNVAELAKGYRNLIAPRYQPEAVQKRYDYPLANDWSFVGIADWIGNVIEDNRRIIADLKTGKTKPDPESSLQLTCYAASEYRESGIWTPVRIEHLSKLKAGAKNEQIDAVRDDSDIPPLVNRVNAFISRVEAIQSGADPLPAPSGSWWCSKTWCGYWGICEYIPKRMK